MYYIFFVEEYNTFVERIKRIEAKGHGSYEGLKLYLKENVLARERVETKFH